MDESHETLEDALIHEVWRHDLSAIHRLLKSGANPNLPGRAWSSAIACAGENDDTGDIVRALVAGGADINIQSEQGLTPLHYAVDIAIDGTIQQGLETIDWSVVGVFLDLGADPNIRDARGKTVYDTASAYGYNARRSFDDFMCSRNGRG
jgi:ankyrin repeat protein